MASIFDIDREIMELIDQETGEIADFDKFEELNMERDRKIENVALWIKELKYTNAALKDERQNLMDRSKRNENLIERLKEYIEKATDGKKFETARCKISFRKSDTLEIDEDADIPDEYMKITATVKKDELKKAVKSGDISLDGVKLVEKKNIIIK